MGSGRLLSLSTSSQPHLNLEIFVLLKASTIELEFWVFMLVSIWGINGSTYSSIDTYQVERRLGIPTLEMKTAGGNFLAKLKNPNFGDFINGRIAYFKRIVVLYSCSPFVDLLFRIRGRGYLSSSSNLCPIIHIIYVYSVCYEKYNIIPDHSCITYN